MSLQGPLEICLGESVSASLRSCYPDFVAKNKGAAVVDEVFPVDEIEPEKGVWASNFQDVQDLLEEHQLAEDAPR